MNFGKWFGVLALWLGSGLAAYAQVGIYAGYTGTRLSGIQCLATTAVAGQALQCSNGVNGPILNAAGGYSAGTNGSVNPSGLFFGGYYDFRTVGPVRLGADVRYIDARSNKSAASATGGKDSTSANTVLGGVRGSFHTPISWLTPYAELAAGRTSTNATEPSCETTAGAIYLCQGGVTTASPRKFDSFVQYEAFGGIDLHVLPIVDLRVIEFGVGNMNRIGSGYGSSSVGVISVGAGVVFHLPPK